MRTIVVWEQNKAIGLGKWSVYGGGRIERFHCSLQDVKVRRKHTYHFLNQNTPIDLIISDNDRNSNLSDYGSLMFPERSIPYLPLKAQLGHPVTSCREGIGGIK